MGSLSSRRRPYPFHLRIGSIQGDPRDRVGLMLLPSETGLLVGRKQQMLDGVVPSAQEYASAPVYRERTLALKPTAGYGERVQSSFGDRRYYWGKNIQVQGGMVGQGPLVHEVAPTSAATSGTVQKFIDAPNSAGVMTLWILSGQGVHKRLDDSNGGQPTSHYRLGFRTEDGVRFKGGFAGATDSLYVAWNDGTIWEKNLAETWAMCALPADFQPTRLEVVGEELWAADTVRCVVRKCTSDPKVAGSWSGPIFVGTPSIKITAIRQTANSLVIFKEDGSLHTLNSDGTTNDLFPGVRVPTDASNGRRAEPWMGALWFRAGPSFYRLEMPGADLTAVGPGKFVDNGSPVRGESRAWCGWGGYQAFLAIWNPLTQTSYLLSYGTWEAQPTQTGVTYVFDDQYDGALAEWSFVTHGKVSTMYVSGASGGDRLYIGFETGLWCWIKLVQSPLAMNSGAEFTVGESFIVFPLHHAMFQADIKHWLGFSVFGPVLRPGDEVYLSYRLQASAGAVPSDPLGDWLPLGEFIHNGQRIDAPPNMAGNALQLRAQLFNINTDSTPVIETVAIHERVVPAFKRDLSGTVNAATFASRLDGAVMRLDSDRVHKAMMDAAASPGSMAIELPDETINEVAFFGYTERMLPAASGGGHTWAIDFQATQFRILTVYGIIRRLRGSRIGDLRGYSIASLRVL